MSRTPYRTLILLTMVAACSEQATPTSTLPVAIQTSPVELRDETLSTSSWQAEARRLVGANNFSALAAGRTYAAIGMAQYGSLLLLPGHHGRSHSEAQRGAIAGASSKVLSFLFPSAATALEERVRSEGNAGPGREHPAFRLGLLLGRIAGHEMIERLQSDGFTTPWTGTVPTGPGMWIANGTPAGATFGNVKPWIMSSGSQFRPPPPPPFNSPAFLADLNEISTLAATRTPAQHALALQWNYATGSFTPPGFWNLTASTYIAEKGLNEREAARVYALTGMAMMDALIGCWDAKYHYWTMRPSQASSMTLSFGLPNHPSYPSGHSCVSSAAATVLAGLFPNKRNEVTTWVTEAGLSRMYAGIHYRFDITAGQQLGERVGRRVLDLDRRFGISSIK